MTTLGPRSAADLGLILPHEHVFVDLRPPDHPDHARAESAAVVALMAPQIRQAQAAGVTALVECTPLGVGRRVDLVLAVSQATSCPLVVPTGVYRQPWVPRWVQGASEDELCAWMIGELREGIADTGVQAGWIKLSASDDGLTPVETKILRAAARAGAATGAVIGTHTIRGRVMQEQLAIVEAAGYTAERVIWIHTQVEPDVALHLEMARRGAWIEYDGLGAADTPEAVWIARIQRVVDAGLDDHLLLSHDRGWYDPAQPGGGVPQPYTYLSERFLPALRQAGLDEATIVRLTQSNPFRAFAR
jgi:phosphotriesterase-related protein